ncbi:MAG: molecular chaperone TorD family protein [Myxococcota bacterium]|nr:molecular chaperone TorD family protein [Myxococcota bacterium]
MREALAAALPFVAWARVWSPLAPAAWRDEAWQALALPGRFSDCESEFLATFVVGLPTPPIPLLLHATLGRDGGAVREDWMRVIAHLGLRFGERTLPPDHLGAACEAIAFAIEREEPVLIREIVKRYLDPWCVAASERLAASQRDDVVARLPGLFAEELRAI